VVTSVLVQRYQVPELDREELEKLPPQLARIIKEKPKPKPAPVAPKKEAKKKLEEKPKPVEKPKVKPKPKPVPKKSVKQPKKLTETKKSTAQQIKKAREVAKSSGLLAMQSDLQALTSTVSAGSFSTNKSQAKSAKSAARVATSDKAALTAESSASAANSQYASIEKVELDGRERSHLEATSDEVKLAHAEQHLSRKDEDIRIVLEGVRSAYAKLYDRALREDPFLEGRLKLRIVIEPNGFVSEVEVLEDTLGNKVLVDKFIARMQLTSFGPAPGGPVETVAGPYEFTPI